MLQWYFGYGLWGSEVKEKFQMKLDMKEDSVLGVPPFALCPLPFAASKPSQPERGFKACSSGFFLQNFLIFFPPCGVFN